MRKIKKVIVLSFLLAFSVLSIYSQDKNDLLNYYDNELIKININSGAGLLLSIDGTTSTLGLGISPVIEKALSSFPDSKSLFQSYKIDDLNGNVLLWGGLAICLGGSLYASYIVDTNQNIAFESPEIYISMSCMVGGLLTELIGAMIMNKGTEDLINAINSYNRNKIKEFYK